MRKLAVGKACVFRVDYKLDIAGGKEFGTVFVNDKENISMSIVAAGWAAVRESGAQQSPFYDQLLQAQQQAKAKGLGVHNDDPKALQEAVREDTVEEDATSLLAAHGKGTMIGAIVDGFISGSLLRVTLTPSKRPQTVMVAGIQCPSMGKKAQADGGEVNEGPEPFAREGRHLAESLCLNRDVKLVIEGVNQYGGLIASLKYPLQGENGADGEVGDLGLALVTAGMARCAEWSLNMMTTGSFKLREAERAARAARRGIWHNHVPQTGNSAKLQDTFSGKVMEIVSGDCLIIMDRANGTERRVMLSSIRAPRPATRDKPAEPWGTEAKEFLRQRLIGKVVAVNMDYSRKIPAAPTSTQSNTEERIMNFGTVQITEKSKDGEKVNNVAELLLVRGLATTVRHRGDEERSAFFENLVNAEEVGKKGKKGVHSAKEAPVTRVNDLSVPGSSAKARQHLPFLQRAGKVAGVCEFVMSGSRLKIYVPKQSVSIAFSPSGVKCPGKDEEFSAEAIAFTRSKALQRNVEITVENVDKIGTFLGSITIESGGAKIDLGESLLESGLAKLHLMTEVSSLPNGQALAAAQEKAQARKIGIWSKEQEARPEPQPSKASAVAREEVSVVITEMVDANTFYVQHTNEPRAQWIADQLKSLDLDAAPSPQGNLKAGALCLAKFDVDNQWYRAKIRHVDLADPTTPQYDVFFIDFGNKGRATNDTLRVMPQALSAVPPQAHAATLAFTHVPVELRDDVGFAAMNKIAMLTNNGSKELSGFKEAESRSVETETAAWGAKAASQGATTVLQLTLFPGEVKDDVSVSINGQIVADGLGKIKNTQAPLSSESKRAFEDLEKVEKLARQDHVGIWEYGDIGDDED